MLLEDQSARGEQGSFSAPLKERHAQPFFEIAHLLGNARLGNPQAIRRAAETPGFRDGEEVAQVADLKRVVLHDEQTLPKIRGEDELFGKEQIFLP